MPGMVNLVRGRNATRMTRGTVPQGAVFAVPQGREGALGTNYAAIGANGRLYSINLRSGDLASSANPGKNVTLTGSWSFNIKLSPNVKRTCLRSEVRQGELFKVHGGEKVYAHMGRITRDHNGWLSIPIANTKNHAVTGNGDSHVDIVGSFTVDAELTR